MGVRYSVSLQFVNEISPPINSLLNLTRQIHTNGTHATRACRRNGVLKRGAVPAVLATARIGESERVEISNSIRAGLCPGS